MAGRMLGGVRGVGRHRGWLVPALLLASVLTSLVTVPGPARAYTPHAPILIDGDAAFTPANGVTGGSGTPGDPYVIDGWDIDASTANGVRIQNTRADFVVRDLSVHSGGNTFSGVLLQNVTNGQVTNVAVSDNYDGILVYSSDNVSVERNAVTGSRWIGIYVTGWGAVTIGNNTVTRGYYGIDLQSTLGVIVDGNNVTGAGGGIYVGDSALGTQVSGNTAWNNSWGIVLHGSDNTLVTGNNISNNRERGLVAEYSFDATLSGNRFTSDGVTITGSVLAHFDTKVITPDNLVNGLPLLAYRDCGRVDVDGVPVGQLIVVNCADVTAANLTISDTDLGVFVAYAGDVVLRNNTVSGTRWGGLSVGPATNVTVVGNTVTGTSRDAGVAVTSAAVTTVSGNTVTDNQAGISVGLVAKATVTGNVAVGNTGQGITVGTSAANVSGNNASGNGEGVGVYSSLPVNVEGNELHDNGIGVIILSSSGTDVRRNNVSGGRTGIYVGSSGQVTIEGNRVWGQVGTSNAAGVYLYTSSPILVANNTVWGNQIGILAQTGSSPAGPVAIEGNDVSLSADEGIFVLVSADVRMVGNRVHGNGVGIRVLSSGTLDVVGNNLSGDGKGIILSSAWQVALSGNAFTGEGLTIEGDWVGYFNSHTIGADNVVNGKPLLFFKDCAGPTVESVPVGQLIVANCANVRVENVTVEDTDVGIEMAFVDGAVLTKSVLAGNDVGVLLHDAGVNGTTRNVVAHHNNFLGNAAQVVDMAANTWDDGYPSGGNYWSDYSGVDNCSGPNQDVCPNPDGIGDTPYVIDADSRDRYPLMTPVPVSVDLPPTVVLNGPDGGERYSGGFPQDVVWTMSDPDTPGNLTVNIELSTDGGTSYAPIALGLSMPQGQDRYTWGVPRLDTALGRIRVTVSDGNSSASAESARDFTIDSTAPRVLSASPPRGATGVSVDAPIAVAFSEPMDPNDTPLAFLLSPAATGVNVTLGGAGDVLTVRHDPLRACTDYAATIASNATDFTTPGNPLAAPYSWSFTTACGPVPAFVSPAGGERWSGGSVHEVVWTTSGEGASFRVSLNYSSDGGADGYPHAVFAGTVPAGTARVSWTVPLIDAADLRLRLAVTDGSNRTAVAESTAFAVDSTPPSVLSITPANGATGVVATSEVRIVFDGPVNRTSAEAAFALDPSPGGLAFRWEVTDTGSPVLVVSHAALAPGAAYAVRMGATLRDDSDPGNLLAAEVSATFTTAAATSVPPPFPWDLLWWILGGGGIALAAMWAFEPSRVALLTLFLAGVHRRRMEDDPESELRGMIRGYIQIRPGDAYTDIRRNLELNNGALTYHLAKLERDGVIKSRIRDGRKRYYPAAAVIPVRENGELCQVQRELVGAVVREPGLSVAVLAGKFGITSQLTLYHLRALKRGGYVSLERRGVRLRAFPTGRVAPHEAPPPAR